jgi:hypothetical protein
MLASSVPAASCPSTDDFTCRGHCGPCAYSLHHITCCVWMNSVHFAQQYATAEQQLLHHWWLSHEDTCSQAHSWSCMICSIVLCKQGWHYQCACTGACHSRGAGRCRLAATGGRTRAGAPGWWGRHGRWCWVFVAAVRAASSIQAHLCRNSIAHFLIAAAAVIQQGCVVRCWREVEHVVWLARCASVGGKALTCTSS